MKDYVQQRNERWNKLFPQIEQRGFWGRVNRLSTFYNNECEQLLMQYGLKRNEYEILCSLIYSGEPYILTPKEITAYAFKTPGAITNGLDNLEKKGFINRMPNKKNRRSTLVGLTKSGEELIRRIFPLLASLENHMLSVIENEKLTSMIEMLKELLIKYEELEKISIPDLPTNFINI